MTTVSVEVEINAPIETVWKKWTSTDDIVIWNHASDDWYCPKAMNNLVVGGTFSYIMSARDKSTSFDFNGLYTTVVPLELIKYTLEGGRKVEVHFKKINEKSTQVIEQFETENENSLDLQKEGWLAILKNFKKHCE